MNQATEFSKPSDAIVYQNLRSALLDAVEARLAAKLALDDLLQTDEQRLAASVYAETHAKHALVLDQLRRCFPHE